MKIKKYDSGGMAIYTPVMLPPQSQTTTPGATTSSSASDKKDDEWEMKKVIEMIQKNGLISDVNVTMDKLKSFYTTAKSLSSNYLFGGDQSYDILAHMFDVQKEINANVVNYDSWKTAQQNAYNQGALGEVATTAGGNIYVWTEKGITSVSPEEYSKNKGTGVYYDFNEDGSDYLTNDELLVIRKELVSGNPYLISSVNSAKGMDTIRKEIRTIVKDFEAKDRQEYVKREGENVTQSTWNGMQILIGEGPDGYYKASTKSELGDINSALEYLWESIGQVGRNKLIAEVAISGGDPTKEEDLFRLILNALDKHTAYSQDVNFEKTATEYDPDGDGRVSNSNSEVTDTLAEKYTSGSGAPPPRYEILMTSKSGVPMYAFMQDLGPILNSDGKSAKGNANVEDVLTNGYGLTTVDKRSITFGDQLIDWADANKIVYDASTNLKRVCLPATKVNGRITPDFEMYNKISELNELVRRQDLSDDQIAKLVESTYSNLTFNRNTGLIEAKNTQLFFTFGAIASTDTYGKDIENSDWRVPQSDEVDRSWQNTYNRLIGYSTNSSTTKGTETGNRETGNGFMPWTWGYKFYKGNIFIPVTEPMLASTIYNDQYWPKEDYRYMTQKAEANARQQIRESASNIKTGF